MENKLVFFNKEGYPYNFNYNSTSGSYKGKLLFDENSSDTFKTIGLYIFEEVKPIKFDMELKMNKMELYNSSGLTFYGSDKKNQIINNIKAVNSSELFFSKWIFGENFDTKFPKGTLVKITDLIFETPVNDFKDDYYTILENKPDAILVKTNIDNNTWDSIFSGGTISSVDAISYNDYDSTMIQTISDYTLEVNKKLSVSGSVINDGVNSFSQSAITNTLYQTWDLTGVTGQTMNLELDLYTERPKLYQGEVIFALSGDSAFLTFKNGFDTTFNILEGEQIIFEDYDDNPILDTNPIFTIQDGVKEFDLYYDNVMFNKVLNTNETLIYNFNKKTPTAKILKNNTQDFLKNPENYENLPTEYLVYDYSIKISGSTETWISDLTIDDIIFFTSDIQDITQKNLNRELTIKKIKTFKDIRIEYWIKEINSYPVLLNAIRENSVRNNTTITEQIYLEALLKYNDEDNNQLSEKFIPFNDRYEFIFFKEYILTETKLNKYIIHKKVLVDDIKTIKCSFTPYTITNQIFTKNVIGYDTTNIVNLTSELIYDDNESTKILDIEKTLNTFNNTFNNELDKYGLMLYSLSGTTINLLSKYHTLNGNYLDSFLYIDNFKNESTGITNSYIETAIIEFEHKIKNQVIYPYETEKLDTKYHSEIMFDLQNNENDYGFNLDINNNEYFINFADSNDINISDTESTINAFIDKYKIILYNQGLDIYSGITTEPVYVDNYKETRISYWIKKIISSPVLYKKVKETALIEDISLDDMLFKEAEQLHESNDTTSKIEYQSGQTTLVVDGLYPNIEVHTLKVKVNLFSEYEIMNTLINKSLFITGNEIEKTISNGITFYDYGLSTGMIIQVSDSKYSQNNKSYNIIGLSEDVIELSYQGLFYDDDTILNIESRTYLRKPRESYNKDIYYSFRFEEPEYDKNVNDNIFFYDFSGEQLKPAKDLITGEYIESTRYIGPKPLWNIDNECDDLRVTLIDTPNTNLEFISDPLKQQTVFRRNENDYSLNYLLDEYDSNTEYDFETEPLQVFIGFNSIDEGVENTKMFIDMVDNTIFSGDTNSEENPNNTEFIFNEDGELIFKSLNVFNFNDFGFEENQIITIDFIDDVKTGTTLFLNKGNFKIEYINGNLIKIDTSLLDYDIVPFYTSGTTSSFKYKIKVQPKNILEVDVYGETEIEDERFKTNLKNVGIDLSHEIEHIFIDSDIKEDGIDYKLLNKKRKEMLIMYPEIYNYIGSYKALVNAINFFGYNDLELNEYYRNIKPDSELYDKLQRVKISDIFDNTVDGWTDTDLINGKYDSGYYKKTNLFNLSYRITDEDGNKILAYSLEELQIKLTKLKKWLKKNMVPLSTNLVDITGEAQTVGYGYHQFDVSNFIKKVECTNETTAVHFNYTQTLNFEHNYLFEIDFYTSNNTIPEGWSCKIQTFKKDENGKLLPQQYIKLMKNDMNSFSFNVDKLIDEYIIIETKTFNDFGLGHVYNKMLNTSHSRAYVLINNNFKVPNDLTYVQSNGGYYWFDESGSIWLEN